MGCGISRTTAVERLQAQEERLQQKKDQQDANRRRAPGVDIFAEDFEAELMTSGCDHSLLLCFRDGSEQPRAKVIVSLLKQWRDWAKDWPSSLEEGVVPGRGRLVPGQSYFHPLVGSHRPLIMATTKPSAGWEEQVEAHARNVFTRRAEKSINIALELAEALAGGTVSLVRAETEKAIRSQVTAGIVAMSRWINTCIQGSRLFLESWPRGHGPGELLEEPVGNPTETPVKDRGICVEWWMEVSAHINPRPLDPTPCLHPTSIPILQLSYTVSKTYLTPSHQVVNRAPFASTRPFVECLVKPVTRVHRCALYFFIPPKYRRKPDVFLSHSWDGSVWDMRPPSDANSLWVDTVVVNQHPIIQGGEGSSHEVSDLFPDVGQIRNSVEQIGRTHVVVPMEHSVGHAIEMERELANFRKELSSLGLEEEISRSGTNSDNQEADVKKERVHSDLTPIADLIPFRRSWCVFEMIFTPEGQLSVHTGWNGRELALYQSLVNAIAQLRVETAETKSHTDKQDIDNFVLERYGTFDRANSELRKITCIAFRKEVQEAFHAGQLSKEDQALYFQRTGAVPLHDKTVLDFYEEKAREIESGMGFE